MRLSLNQKDILFVLLALERSLFGDDQPVQSVDLLKIINQTRSKAIFSSNLRVGLHTLHKNGLVRQYRTSSLKLAYLLTDTGRVEADKIHKQRENNN